MQLVVTEKPSVAQAISHVIGAKERKDGYMEGNGFLVSVWHSRRCSQKHGKNGAMRACP